MEEITFRVQGSALDPYIVSFKKNGTNLTAQCTCPAGLSLQICKHRIRILEGSAEGVVSNNHMDIARASSWLVGSNIEAALAEVKATEEQLEKAKRELSATKKKLARILHG